MPDAYASVDVPKLAHAYRRLVLWFGVQLVVNVLSAPFIATSAPGPAVGVLSVVHLVGLFITVAALSIYAYRIAAAYASKVPMLWAVAMLIPWLNGITLVALSARAAHVCRAKGIAVGLLGPKIPASLLPAPNISQP